MSKTYHRVSLIFDTVNANSLAAKEVIEEKPMTLADALYLNKFEERTKPNYQVVTVTPE
jgi:hypothetical protein